MRTRLVAVIGGAALLASVGCISVKAPERITVGSGGSRPVDTSRVPPTRDHAHAREKLAEAYARIDYLEDELRDCEKDKRELERDDD
ncbi:MAG: hypothetical protein KDA32_10495 [Phycisphaerales bacterium]|nr:hypothetical protein [Phycisphaerales bacterium]